MRRELILRLHQDDNTGTWGLTHVDTVGSFNAFWGADGIFHDVFEHWMEHEHKYFSGRSACTIYGEMAASGQGIAYSEIGIDNFKYRDTRYSGTRRDFTADTTALLVDFVHGHTEDTDFSLEHCIIPHQKIKYSAGLHHWLNMYEDWYRSAVERKPEFKKLVKWKDIRNAYILGYKLGREHIGENQSHSFNVLDQFLDDWNMICQDQPNELYIDHEDNDGGYGIYGFKFYIDTKPELSVRYTVLDDLRREYDIKTLISS